MIRFAWLTTACAVLLTACGGGVSSPDFQGQLVGVDILFPSSTTTSTARVTPGTTVQFDAVGLYSTAPGTTAGTGLVSCPTAADTERVCRQGSISGVSWSVDASGTTVDPVATISSSGLVSGVRRGTATVRARVANLEDATQPLIVNGPVLNAISVSSVEAKYGQAATSVPTGRSFVLTGVATCASGFSGGTGADAPNSNAVCTNLDYQYRWSLPTTTPASAVSFTPTSAVGEAITVKTNRFGPLQIIATYTNEEGIQKQQTINLNASEPVLDSISVAADPVQVEPVAVVIGAKTRFLATGTFSDGTVGEVKATDLRSPLVWSADASAVGQITIDNANGATPNAAVLVAGDVVGTTGLTATGSNIETNVPNKPNGLDLSDRIPVSVRNLGLIKLVDICPAAATASECAQGVQIPVNSTVAFKARGQFQGESEPRDIDPGILPLTWSKTVTASTGDVTVVTSGTQTTGEFVGKTIGPVTLGVTLANAASEPTVVGANRVASAAASVVEAECRDQLISPAAVAVGSDDVAEPGSSVSNPGNVTDGTGSTFATMTAGAALIGGNLTLSVNRTGLVVTPTTARSVGFVIKYPSATTAAPTATIKTLNAAGGVVDTYNAVEISGDVARPDLGGAATDTTFHTFKISPLLNRGFTGIQLDILVPGLLLDGETNTQAVSFRAYTACMDVVE